MQGVRQPNDRSMVPDEVDQNLIDAFPASDPPSRTLGTDHVAAGSGAAARKALQESREMFRLSREVHEGDHVQGEPSAAVTLLMYGAYECPYCVEGNMIVKKIQGHFGDELRFVFRHFPRTDVHPHAEAAAEVAEAAGEQGRFWEMHDLLFENYNRLDGEHLLAYASGLGLDMERFDQAIVSRKFSSRVREDLVSGIESGVKGTPTYFINGVKYNRSGELDVLLAAIRDAH